MIAVKEVPGTSISEITIDGRVTAGEFEDTLEKLSQAIERHGTIRVLEHVVSLDLPPIPWSKLWDDIKFSFDHLSDVTHAAVVTDQSWILAYVRLLNPLFKAELKAFRPTELNRPR